MPAPPSAAPLVALLAAIRRQARAWIWLESLALAAVVAAASVWIAVAIDRLVEPPAAVRGVMLVAAGAAVAWVLATRLTARLAVPLSDEALALVVERHHPRIGDALSTAMACGRHAASATDAVDPDLVARTIAAATAAVADVRPAELFRRRRLAGLAALAVAACAATAAAAATHPGLAAIGMRRLLLLDAVAWPRRVHLEAVDFPGGVRTVARGSSVDVLVRMTAEGAAPEVVDLRTRARGRWRVDRMGMRGAETAEGRAFGHVIESLGEDLDVEVRAGDARLRGLRIVVADPPVVADVSITATLPDYLGGGTRPVAASRTVQVPRGALVDITCTATKPLSAATLAVRPAGDDAAEHEEVVATLSSSGERAVSARIPAVLADTAVLARLTDTLGLGNRDPLVAMVLPVPDAPPAVALRLAGISTAVTPQAVLAFEGTISDDHAVADATVRLTAGDLVRESGVAEVTAGARAVEFAGDRPLALPLAEQGLEVGGRLDVVVLARDRCTLDGRPNEGRSETWTLDVVAPETLKAMLEGREVLLRRRLETVVADLGAARDAVTAAVPPADAAAVARCGEATSRGAGEVTEIAEQFRSIRREFAANGLLAAEVEARLIGQIAEPLAAVAAGDLARAARACREGGRGSDVLQPVDAAIARLRAVLERMLELESVNEVVERLRGVIRAQEEIRRETLESQRKRGREALESP